MLDTPISALDTFLGVVPVLSKLLAHDSNVRLICVVDYDGTLVPIVSDPSAAVANKMTSDVVLSLCSIPNCHVIVSSGRGPVLKSLLGLDPSKIIFDPVAHSPPCSPRWGGLSLSMAHGFLVEAPFGSLDRSQDIASSVSGAHMALSRAIQDDPCCRGATLEKSDASLTCHYRNIVSDPAVGNAALESVVDVVAKRHGLEKRPGKMAFELRSPLCDKGTALHWALKHLAPGPLSLTTSLPSSTRPSHTRNDVNVIRPVSTLLITIGDDATDEDLHREAEAALARKVVSTIFTIKVSGEDGPTTTRARFTLKSPQETLQLLTELRNEFSTHTSCHSSGTSPLLMSPKR